MFALSLRDTSKDQLRALGACRHRVDVGSTRRLCCNEAENEGEDDGEDGETGADVVLKGQHDHGEGDRGKNTNRPAPGWHLLRLWRRVLNLSLLTREVLGCEAARLGDLLGRLENCPLQATVENGAVHGDLSEGGAEHDHDANPQVPVSRGRAGLGVGQRVVAVPAREGVLASILVQAQWDSECRAVLDGQGTDKCPCKHASSKEREGRVHTGKDTRTDECRGVLEDPAPGLSSDDAAPSPGVQPPEDMVVPQDTGSVDRDDTQESSTTKGSGKTLRLPAAAGLAGGTTGVQGSDGVCHRGGGGEDELELQDVELSEGDGEEQSVVGGADGEGDELAEVWGKVSPCPGSRPRFVTQVKKRQAQERESNAYPPRPCLT